MIYEPVRAKLVQYPENERVTSAQFMIGSSNCPCSKCTQRVLSQKYDPQNVPYYVTSYLGVTLIWPDGFYLKNESKTKLFLIDYIIYVSSSFGIWFGISLIWIGVWGHEVYSWRNARDSTELSTRRLEIIFGQMCHRRFNGDVTRADRFWSSVNDSRLEPISRVICWRS